MSPEEYEDYCWASCAPVAQQVSFRPLYLDMVSYPQTYIRVNGFDEPVDVPTAEPPEWYAAYLEECWQPSLPRDDRTSLQRSEYEWEALKIRIDVEDYSAIGPQKRHKVWG